MKKATKRTIELKRGKRVEVHHEIGVIFVLKHVVVEQIAASPDGKYPAGSGVCVTLQLEDGYGHAGEEELCRLTPPYGFREFMYFQGRRIRWVDLRSPLREPILVLEVQKLSPKDYDALGTFVLDRGKPVVIDDDMTVTLAAHGHKRTRPGKRSPLILTLDYTQRGKETASGIREKIWLGDESRSSWHRGRYRFELVDNSYNRSTKVTVRRARDAPR